MKHQIIGLILYSSILFASPTIYGPTGVIEMPSAESIAYKQVNVAVDYAMNNYDDGEKKITFIINLIWDRLKIGSWEYWAGHF